MNILIINAHSSRNKGDAGIVLSMIDSMREVMGDCQIRIKSRFPEIDQAAYDVPVHACVENIQGNQRMSKKMKLKMVLRMMKILNTRYRDTSGDYEWADVVVSCGGGFLLTHGLSLMTLQHLVQIKVAYDYKKPVVIYSQSIGPFYNTFVKLVAAKVLRGVTKTFIREKISFGWLEKMGITKGVEIVPDSAFCMNMVRSDRIDSLVADIKRSSCDRPLVGITVRDWNFPEAGDSAFHRSKYIDSICKAIAHLESLIQAKILLMPQVLGPNPYNDDRNISREILAECSNHDAQLLDFDFSPRELKYLYSKMDMFIGTRMHSNIFALSGYVPTVAINYEHKTRGIMEMLGLEDLVVDISEITPEKLIGMVDHCWQERDRIVAELRRKMPQVVDQAAKPAIFIQSLYNQQAQNSA